MQCRAVVREHRADEERYLEVVAREKCKQQFVDGLGETRTRDHGLHQFSQLGPRNFGHDEQAVGYQTLVPRVYLLLLKTTTSWLTHESSG